MKTNKVGLLVAGCFVVMSSSVDARYKSQILKKGSSQVITHASKDYIAFEYKILTAKDCQKFFNNRNIIKKGFQPVQITFINNSDKAISISPQGFDFEVVPAQKIADSLHRNGMKRGVGLGVASLAAGWVTLVPALVQGCGAKEFNVDMDNDFANKQLKDQVVLPGKTVTGVVFANRNNFDRDFTFTVQDQDKQLVLSTYQPSLHMQNVAPVQIS